MNERDLISTQTIKQVSEGGDKVRADLKATASAQDQLAASSTNLAAATETSARRQTSAAAAFNALQMKADPAARALAELERAQRTVSRALDQGVASQSRANDVLSVYAARASAAATAANAAAIAEENRRRTQSNASVNQGQGFNPSSANTSTYAAQYEAAARAQDMMAASASKLRTAINPLEAEQGRLAAELRGYKQALDSGKISQTEFAAAHAMAGKRLGDFAQNLKSAGTAGRVMSGELVNMGYQLNDVVTGLALGQSPFMIIAQQGGQIVQILQNSQVSIGQFAATAIRSFGSIFTASRVLVGGVAGLGFGMAGAAHSWIESQREIERSLIGIGARTGTTIADINKFASANASATGLSVDQARSSAIEFTKTGNIAVGQLKGLGDAVRGYSILTGKDATDATKDLAQALSGDLVAGAEKLNQTYGFLNPVMEDNIRHLVNQGQRAKAQQVIINAMADDNRRAEATVSGLAKAWDAVWNAASRAKNAIGEAMIESPAEERARLQAKIDTGTAPGLNRGRQRRVDEINTQQTGNAFAGFEAEQNSIAMAADAVTKAIIPQIKQIQDLESAYAKLGAAQDQGGNASNGAAQQAIQNQIAALQEAQGQAERYNQRVSEISKSWGDVGQSTALSLQAMQNSLPVAQAVGGAAKLQAQYQADYNNALDQGLTKEEAMATAKKKQEIAQAQINSGAKEMLFDLQNQAAVAGAVTGAQQIQAQGQATYNKLVHDGVAPWIAQAVAAQQVSNAVDQATAAVRKQVHSLEQSTEMIKAQANGTEAATAAAQAYENAIRSGASAMAANALSAATLENYLTKAAVAAQKIEQADIQKANEAFGAQYNAAGALVGVDTGAPSKGGTFSLAPGPGATYKGGSRGGWDPFGSITQMMRISELLKVVKISSEQLANQRLTSGGGFDAAIAGLQTAGRYGGLTDDPISQIGSLYDLKNAQTSNKSLQIANLQEQMSWLQTLPETISRDQRIISLQQSIDALKNSTDANTAATSATLNPLYSQGRGALAIGYYKAAGGLDMIASGPSSGDQVPFNAMINGGERVRIETKEQQANDNSRQISITQNFYGQSSNNQRRNRRQASQGFAQSIAAVG